MTTLINFGLAKSVLTKVTSSLRSYVIRQYLHGYSMNEIEHATPLSKGSVNNIIQKWKAGINGTDIEEIRGFITEVRESG